MILHYPTAFTSPVYPCVLSWQDLGTGFGDILFDGIITGTGPMAHCASYQLNWNEAENNGRLYLQVLSTLQKISGDPNGVTITYKISLDNGINYKEISPTFGPLSVPSFTPLIVIEPPMPPSVPGAIVSSTIIDTNSVDLKNFVFVCVLEYSGTPPAHIILNMSIIMLEDRLPKVNGLYRERITSQINNPYGRTNFATRYRFVPGSLRVERNGINLGPSSAGYFAELTDMKSFLLKGSRLTGSEDLVVEYQVGYDPLGFGL